MDTELIKTFLEVNRTRHFGKAAENLFITQSAVSARIRLLEDQLGVRLFSRERNNIQLTRAGEKLVPHAEGMMSVWTRARAEIAVDDDSKVTLSVGAVPSIWDIFLQRWLERVNAELPELVLSADAQSGDELRRRIAAQTLDLAFVFDAPSESDLEVRECFSVDLIMVASAPDATPEEAASARYILVDWGTRFSVMHAKHFLDLPTPIMRTSLGRIARDFVLAKGGSAYLAETMVAADIANKRLHLVPGAPRFSRTIYAVFRFGNDRSAVIERALALTDREVSLSAVSSGKELE